jgi:hypothetical protein
MRSKEFLSESKKIILEGGNMFSSAEQFDQKDAPKITKAVNDILSSIGIHVIPVGSGATPTPGKKSGDFDVMADEALVMQKFNAKDGKAARKALAEHLASLGYEVAQSGINVHLLVPVGSKHVQADIMVTPNAAAVSQFHRHILPPNSPYKGVHKQILLSAVAKTKNMMWSPWQGLFARTQDGKRGEFISNDLDKIATSLLGNGATSDDLGSVESILAKLPEQNRIAILTQLQSDPNWTANQVESK